MVGVSILVEVEREGTAGADMSEMSAASDGKLRVCVVVIPMRSLGHQGSSKVVDAQPVGCDCPCSQMDSRTPDLAT